MSKTTAEFCVAFTKDQYAGLMRALRRAKTVTPPSTPEGKALAGMTRAAERARLYQNQPLTEAQLATLVNVADKGLGESKRAKLILDKLLNLLLGLGYRLPDVED